MKRVLILGGTGFIGKNLFRRLEKDPQYDVVAVSKSTGVDILDFDQIASCIKEIKPDVLPRMAEASIM